MQEAIDRARHPDPVAFIHQRLQRGAKEVDRLMAEATWDRPDFNDSRFSIEGVREVQTCRHPNCDRLAAYLVEYTMRRGGWTYDYECGYCADHLPQRVRDAFAIGGLDG